MEELIQILEESFIEIQEYIDDPRGLIEAGKYQEALALFKRAQDQYPKNVLIYVKQCEALFFLDRLQDALDAAEYAVRLLPCAYTYSYQGSILLGLERYQEALAVLDQALQLEPAYAVCLINQATTLNRLKRYQEVLRVLEAYLQIQPANATAHKEKGLALSCLHEDEQAVNAYEQALRLDPNDANIIIALGDILTRSGRDELALDVYEQALRCEPPELFAATLEHHLKKANHERPNKQQEEALALLQRPGIAFTYEWGAELYRRKGDVLTKLGRYQEAVAAYNAALGSDANDIGAYRNKALNLFQLKHHQEAITAFEHVLHLDPTSEDICFFLAEALSYVRRYKQALKRYQQALELKYVRKGLIYRGTGRALFHLKRYREAIAAFDQAQLSFGAQNDETLFYYEGRAYYRLKRYQEALDLYQAAQHVSSGKPARRLLLELGSGDALTHLRRSYEANKAYVKMLDLSQSHFSPRAGLEKRLSVIGMALALEILLPQARFERPRCLLVRGIAHVLRKRQGIDWHDDEP